MPDFKEIPSDFWNPDRISPKQVLDEMVTEALQPAKLIKGFGELLLESDLSEKQRDDVEVILTQINYLTSILAAARHYIIKIDHRTGD
jgi:hypothetical protein